jgi:hypothetical protein
MSNRELRKLRNQYSVMGDAGEFSVDSTSDVAVPK